MSPKPLATTLALVLLACSTDRPSSNGAGTLDAGGGGRGGESAGGPTVSVAPQGGSGAGGEGGVGGPESGPDAATPSDDPDSGAGGAPAEAGVETPLDAGPDGGSELGDASDAGSDGGPSDLDGRFVPEGLAVTNLSGEESGFNVVASTLVDGPNGPELYAALRNDRDISGCDGAVSVELFDRAGQSVGAWITGLQSRELFRRDDGMDGLVSCVSPGGSAMAAVTDLPEDLAIEEMGTALYQLTYFDREILPFGLIPVEEIVVSDIEAVAGDAGFVFTGTLENGLDVPLQAASVTLFPVTDVGRPLAAVNTTSTADVAPGESWTFETTGVVDPGVSVEAFPRATVAF